MPRFESKRNAAKGLEIHDNASGTTVAKSDTGNDGAVNAVLTVLRLLSGDAVKSDLPFDLDKKV